MIETVRDLLDIPRPSPRVTKIIAGHQLTRIKKQFGDARKSEIVLNAWKPRSRT